MKETAERYRRKAGQHYEMAGLARLDGDQADATRHMRLAKEYDRLAGIAKEEEGQ